MPTTDELQIEINKLKARIKKLEEKVFGEPPAKPGEAKDWQAGLDPEPEPTPMDRMKNEMS